MGSFQITTNEVGDLATALTLHAVRFPAKANPLVRKALLDIEAGAKVRAPVDTGNLQNSIRAEQYATTLGGEVIAHAEYARFVEWGTSRMAPRPYMQPSADAVIPGFESAMAQLGVEIF